MSLKLSDWRGMQRRLLKQIETEEEKMKKQMSSYYRKQAAVLRKEIAAFFMAYGSDGTITYRNAMLPMPAVEQVALSSECKAFAVSHPDHASLLPEVDTIHRLSRLDGLQCRVRLQSLNSGAYEKEKIEDHLKSVCILVSENVSEIIGRADAKRTTYVPDVSNNIFQNKVKLAGYLETDVAQGIARGEDFEKLSDAVCDRMIRVSQNDTNRLMYTEDTEAISETEAEILEDYFESYVFRTMQDGSVCEKCRWLDGEEFLLAERRVGVNFPPIHPWCRCMIEPSEGSEII